MPQRRTTLVPKTSRADQTHAAETTQPLDKLELFLVVKERLIKETCLERRWNVHQKPRSSHYIHIMSAPSATIATNVPYAAASRDRG
ncbi:hypothetical protein [Streptomyces sp. NBC_01594]|uniref:hypothetical protein n=1 Tax=Streptomyces sp. NBC_01594 TaxID=2975890 RepID=UPI00386C7129